MCAGVGGLDLGLPIACPGYRTVGYVEREAYAAAALVARMADKALDQAPVWDDLTTFDGRPWRGVVDAYAQAYGRWVEAERAIAKMAEKDQLTGGLMIKTSNGNAIQNPLVGTANKAASDMMRYAAEFGMTPSARSRISAEATSEGANPADRFFS